MADFRELLNMAMDSEGWVKGVQRVSDLICRFPRGMAEAVSIDAQEHRVYCLKRKDSKDETEEEKLERWYTKEIWEQACNRVAWLDYQIPPKRPWEREENQHGR